MAVFTGSSQLGGASDKWAEDPWCNAVRNFVTIRAAAQAGGYDTLILENFLFPSRIIPRVL